MQNALSSIFFLSLILLFEPVDAEQNSKADSLKSRLEQVSGREKLSTLLELCEVYRNTSPKSGIEIGRQALALAEHLEYKEQKFSALRALGIAYSQEGRYESALEYLLKAHRFAETEGFVEQLADASYGIAGIYRDLGVHDKFMSFAQKALDIYTRIDNKIGKAKSLNLIAIYHDLNKEYDLALDYFQKSLALAREIDEAGLVAGLQNNIGNIYFIKKDTLKGMEYYYRSQSVRKKQEATFNDAIFAMNMGGLLVAQNDLKKAEKHFKHCKKIVEKLNSDKLSGIYHRSIADFHAKKNDHKEAFQHLKKSILINDSLLNEQVNSKIADLEVKHAVEFKSKENQLLRKENRIQQLEIYKQYVFGILMLCILLLIIWLLVARYRGKMKDNELLYLKNKVVSQHQKELLEAMHKLQKSEEDLRRANETKDTMFSLIAHDLRGSVGNITSGLRMMLNDKELELTEEDKAEFLQTLYNSSDNSYELLENLLFWARNQSHTIAVDPVMIELNQIILSNIDLLSELAKIKSIDLLYTSFEEVLVYADRNMMQTVVRNLLSNAIKFTRRKGQVEVRTEVFEDYVKVLVIDNGIGMPPEQVANIYKGKTTVGTENEKGTGLGLMLCRDFLEDNDGELSVESELGKGSTFSFTIPREQRPSREISDNLREEAFISPTNS